ncbi:hypothetical protein MB02_12430 [Croceicoccus estronivorus]|uniref:TonB-dependent receptor n=1 Tax=Croceicoccus estronivorus TaxID=1172626 RepID=UPI0008303D1A|nr:TonB-dependent receptor [Croceicoccus estronivorus]OCC23415.1 hypothetical protein MB02_12430 [Croceicoccus estronivorus]
MKLESRILVAGSFSALCLASPAKAEISETASAAEVDGSDQGGLEQIVVTARRRAENIQQTPLAVSAFSGNTLDNRSAADAVDLAQFVPNLNATTGLSGGSAANYFIRGVGQVDHVATVDPGVSVYVDGVYLGRTNGADVATLDLQRVEVLRGPQGTLFGKNTIGGAISIYTNQPDNELAGAVKLIGGSREHFEGRGWLNIPIVEDKLAARIAASYRTQHGYGYRYGDGHRFGDERTGSIRAQLQWHVTDTLTFNLAGDYTRTRGNATLVQLTGAGPLGFLPEGYSQYETDSRRHTYAGLDAGNRLNGGGAALTATLEIGAATLKSISAYRGLHQLTGTDYDGGPGAVIDQKQATRQHQFSQELQLGGKALNDALDWVIGGYYFKEKIDQAVPIYLNSPTALNQLNFIDTENLAGFGQASLSVTDKLSLTAGARITREKKTQHFQSFFLGSHEFFQTAGYEGLINTPESERGVETQPYAGLSKTWTSFTPKLSVEFKPSRDLMLYASWSKGFKSGGFNSRGSSSEGFIPYDPEKMQTYEVGLKADLLDRHLRVNLAGFYSRYNDLQLLVLQLSQEGAAQIVTRNAAKAEVYGFEAELTARPVENLELNAAVGFLENKYLELDPGTTAAGIEKGDKLPQSPKWTVNLGAQYTVPLSSGASITGRVDYTYKSEFYFFAANNPLDVQKPYGLFNARLSYETPSGLEVAGFVHNLFDKFYYSQREDVRSSYDVALSWPAPPRSWGIELGYQF